MKVVTLNVGMTCSGCSGAVTRILGKIDGVQDVSANVETKIVAVTCEDAVEDETIVAALQKWSVSSGKSVEFVGSEAKTEDA